ncbi:hypothetical protein PENSPDRAFT_690010 [Peniophora sp. CONT]|nr:hypothetical protein PENSPDRAFT_690010 [Peniophora sp. CONT]
MKFTVATALPLVLASMASVAAISPRITLHFSDGTSSTQYESDASCQNVASISSTPTSALQIEDFNFYCFAYDGVNCTENEHKLNNTNWYNLNDLTPLTKITSFFCYEQFFC